MEETVEKIREMDLKGTYEWAISEEDLPEKIKEGMRFGISLRFDIYDLFNGIIQIKEKKRKFIYNGRSHPLEELWTEREARTQLGKRWLIKKYSEGEFKVKAREAR